MVGGRVGGFAADAVMVDRKIIRRDSGADNDRRVGSEAANPTLCDSRQRACV